MQHAEVTSLFLYPRFLSCLSMAGFEKVSVKYSNRSHAMKRLNTEQVTGLMTGCEDALHLFLKTYITMQNG